MDFGNNFKNMGIISEQIKQVKDNYYHTKKYEDGSISSEPIDLETYLTLYAKFGQRSYWDY